MAISTNDPRINPDLLVPGQTSNEKYERNNNGEIKFAGNTEPESRLFVNLTKPVFDREELRKVVDREISQLTTEQTQEINRTTIG